MSENKKMPQAVLEQIQKKEDTYKAIVAEGWKCKGEKADAIYSTQLTTFIKRLDMYLNHTVHKKEPKITVAQGCNIFFQVMALGLSFSEDMKHVYLGTLPGGGGYVCHQIARDGYVYMARRSGQVKNISEVGFVYKVGKGEQPQGYITVENGRHKLVHHRVDMRKFSLDALEFAYVFLERPNGVMEVKWTTGERLLELREKSTLKNMYDDESFIKTKVTKNALKGIIKLPSDPAVDEAIEYEDNGDLVEEFPDMEPFQTPLYSDDKIENNKEEETF